MLLCFSLGLALMLLQFNPVQERLAAAAERSFNENYEGELSIGGISGTIPVTLRLHDITLTYQNSEEAEADTVLAASLVDLDLDLYETLFGRFTITSLRVEKPSILLKKDDESGNASIQRAFSRTQKREPEERRRASDDRFVPSFDLQTLEIADGSLQVKKGFMPENGNENFSLPSEFKAEEINLRMGIEFSEEEQFLNFRELSGRSDDFNFESFVFRGQIYTDDRFLEFNRISLQTPASMLRFTLNFEDVNIQRPNLAEQMQNAGIYFRLEESFITASEFRDIIPALPDTDLPLIVSMNVDAANGSAELTMFELRYGESALVLNGSVENIPESYDYKAIIDFANLHSEDVEMWLNGEVGFREAGIFTVRGEVEGSRSHAKPRLEITSDHGNITSEFLVNWAGSIPEYEGDVVFDGLDFSAMPSLGLDDSRLNAHIELDGKGIEARKAESRMSAKIVSSRIRGFVIDELNAEATIHDGFLEPLVELTQSSDGGRLRLSGWVDFMRDELYYNFEGITSNFNPQHLYPDTDIREGRINSNFTLMATGSDLDTYSGEVYLNVYDSDYGDEHIEDHEFYASLDEAGRDERTLILGGTLLEAELTGDLVPSRLAATAAYWSREISRTIDQKTLYGETFAAYQTREEPVNAEIISNKITFSARIDDLRLLNKVVPGLPEISTISNFDLKVKTTPDQIEIESLFNSDYIETTGLQADSLVARSKTVFKRGRSTDFLIGGYEVQIGRFTLGGQEFRETDIYLDVYDEALVLQRFRSKTGDDTELGIMLSAVFSDRDVDVRIMDFFVGDEEYTWRNIRETPIRIDDRGRMHVDRLEFGNLQERFLIDGVFSENPEDSVSYLASGLQLERISDIISGRVSFGGELDGTFVTRTLRTDPDFQGDLRIEALSLDDRLIGDIGFRSRYSQDEERFLTRLTIRTDPERYEQYLTANQDIGQDIIIEGFFNSLGRIGEENIIGDFDLTLNEVDLWILPLIVDGVFDKLEGRAKGKGNFKLLTDGIEFDSEFEVMDVNLRPVFLEADLTLNGNIGLNSDSGVTFKDVDVRDTRNGSGVLSGTIYLNLFDEESTRFDTQLEMNNLTFLSNSAGPDVPFFGRGVGSGTVRLSGTSDQPFISTPSPVVLTSASRISIPVSTDPSVEGGTRFIQFVDDFNTTVDINEANNTPNGNNKNNNQGNGQNGEEADLTFMERFGFDLQFQANENMTVRLIFDEVTSEILSARGTGRIRLTLQDEVFQVFGRFDVAGGDYLFVGGDIFSRRFTIRDGGTISWDGDPVNANIDVQAVYRARPNINLLREGVTAEEAPVRVPVDLVLEITGALDSIENDFYFEFPSTADITQTTAILARLRDEDIKLLQATSVLLTGNFTPIDTQLNELFTSQLGAQGLGTLLSSQITSILNANISNVDVDLNLTTFEEADLGIALRLFDDRLTLRREGTISGPNSNIGDFDVRYQINRYFAIEAFMRREQLLPTSVSVGQTQSDETYGVGVEARVQFNTWTELRNRVWGAFRGVFTSRKEESEEEEETTVAGSD